MSSFCFLQTFRENFPSGRTSPGTSSARAEATRVRSQGARAWVPQISGSEAFPSICSSSPLTKNSCEPCFFYFYIRSKEHTFFETLSEYRDVYSNGEKMNPFTGFLETLWAKNPKSWAWWSTGDRCGVNHQNPNHLLKLLNSLLPSKGVQMAAERLSRFGRMWKAQVNLWHVFFFVQTIFWGKRYYKNCGNL